MRRRKWCNHIEIMRLKTPQGWVYWYILGSLNIDEPTAFNVCPICGARRPKVESPDILKQNIKQIWEGHVDVTSYGNLKLRPKCKK